MRVDVRDHAHALRRRALADHLDAGPADHLDADLDHATRSVQRLAHCASRDLGLNAIVFSW